MKEKSNRCLTIVFGVIAILLLGYIYWEQLTKDKNETTSQNTLKKVTTTKDIVGIYAGIIKNSNTKEEIMHSIYLTEDAMFSYVLKGDDEVVVYIGNYFINNNTITLNYWFDTDEKLKTINIVNNKEQLIINYDGTISLESKDKLRTLTGEDKKDELSNKVYDVNYILSQVASNVRQ